MENIKSVQESPYSQINDLEDLYAKPNMEAMQSGQTSGIYVYNYDNQVIIGNLYTVACRNNER